MSKFTRAVRSQRSIHAAIDGPSGSGKTYSGLRMAFALVDAGMAKRVAVIDTENSSASLYAGEAPDGRKWEFDTLNLRQFCPDHYTAAINDAVKEGYDAIFIDGLSQAWVGEGGALDIVDAKTGGGGNKFTAWKDVTPLHRRMVDTIIRCPAHIIVTMRSKTEWVLEPNDKGKMVPRKIGVAPVQREGMEYEFDLYASMDWSHQIRVSKSRCSPMQDATTMNPGPRFWTPMFDWLNSADTVHRPEPTEPEPVADTPAPQRIVTVPPNGGAEPHTIGALPKSGKELYRRIADYSKKLEDAERCERGELMKYVAAKGRAAGFPDLIVKWSGEQIEFGVAFVREFERSAA